VITYKNHDVGTFTLVEDQLAWVDHEGAKGALDCAKVTSVRLGEDANGGSGSMGQSAQIGVMDGTTIKTVSGTPPTDMDGGDGEWAMTVRTDQHHTVVRCSLAQKDDGQAFRHFVCAVHQCIARANPSARFTGGGWLPVVVIVFLSLILAVLGGGAGFMG